MFMSFTISCPADYPGLFLWILSFLKQDISPQKTTQNIFYTAFIQWGKKVFSGDEASVITRSSPSSHSMTDRGWWWSCLCRWCPQVEKACWFWPKENTRCWPTDLFSPDLTSLTEEWRRSPTTSTEITAWCCGMPSTGRVICLNLMSILEPEVWGLYPDEPELVSNRLGQRLKANMISVCGAELLLLRSTPDQNLKTSSGNARIGIFLWLVLN